MKLLQNLATKCKPNYFIAGYLLLLSVLVLFKIKNYNYNLSALIGIWKGFAELNPDFIETGFVIYEGGGYDGQFFYFIAKYLYTTELKNLPILDSFFIRFNRIGLSIITGGFTKVFGFSYYPIVTLLVLTLTHIYSFILLRKMLSLKNKYLALFHLFSPITLNSNLLLLSDSLFISFTIFCLYFMNTMEVNVFKISVASKNKPVNYVLLFVLLSFTCFIRETGVIFAITILFIFLYDRRKEITILASLSIICYLIITNLFKSMILTNPGTNPLGFLDLIDFPLFGFYKSIQIHSFSDIKSLFREFAKFPIFLLFLILIFNLKNIKTLREGILFIPIYFTLFTIGIGEVGYWLSFDNISRMFALSIPWIILLKNTNSEYKDFYLFQVLSLILILLIIRIIYIKSQLEFFIY